MKIAIVVDVEGTSDGSAVTPTKLRELVECWVHEQLGSWHEVYDPNTGDKIGEIEFSPESGGFEVHTGSFHFREDG